MTCINCGDVASATAELGGVMAAFCCSHVPFGRAKVTVFAPCI